MAMAIRRGKRVGQQPLSGGAGRGGRRRAGAGAARPADAAGQAARAQQAGSGADEPGGPGPVPGGLAWRASAARFYQPRPGTAALSRRGQGCGGTTAALWPGDAADSIAACARPGREGPARTPLSRDRRRGKINVRRGLYPPSLSTKGVTRSELRSIARDLRAERLWAPVRIYERNPEIVKLSLPTNKALPKFTFIGDAQARGAN